MANPFDRWSGCGGAKRNRDLRRWSRALTTTRRPARSREALISRITAGGDFRRSADVTGPPRNSPECHSAFHRPMILDHGTISDDLRDVALFAWWRPFGACIAARRAPDTFEQSERINESIATTLAPDARAFAPVCMSRMITRSTVAPESTCTLAGIMQWSHMSRTTRCPVTPRALSGPQSSGRGRPSPASSTRCATS